MSTIAVTNVKHPSAVDPAIVLDADGDVTYAGVHDFSAATVTGAGGLRLITPTSIANSGGSASLSGGEITFTGITTISLNGVFSSAYDNYRILINTNLASFQIPCIRLRASGTDNSTASSYNIYSTVREAKTLYSTLGCNGRTFLPIEVMEPFLAVPTLMNTPATTTTDNVFQNISACVHNQSTSYDGFTLFVENGAVAQTGKLRVYGYQKS